jgi:hypothetical protein
VLDYYENQICIFILKYTGIRYENINFEIRKQGKRLIVEDQYNKYMEEFNIKKLIKEHVEIRSVFEDYNKNQKNLENFTETNIKE